MTRPEKIGRFVLPASPQWKAGRTKPWLLDISATVSESRRRQRRFFASQAEAKTALQAEKARVRNSGLEMASISPQLRLEAVEAERILERHIEARSLDLPEIQALGFEAVVRDKACRAARLLGVPALVEDSGLAVRAWNGFPGPLTKWVTESVGQHHRNPCSS